MDSVWIYFFRPFCRRCPENFAENRGYQTRQIIFHRNVSVMIKPICFLSFVKHVHELALDNCWSENKLLQLYGLKIQQLVYI